ncbi:MAG: sigma-70 family RNA polymerase sigma factor [Bacteroidales bacterium]|nr:sigma-70 family RNA polymerase sigma factor [Bacteroidales bacterium]
MYQEEFSDISKWDDKCFQAFIRENAAVFRVFASKYVHDSDVIDDILQEAYIKLWTNRVKIGVVRSPRNYFFTIIKNTIFDYKGYFQPENMERDPENYEKIRDDDFFLRNIIEVEASGMIAQAIMKLSAQSQRVILMSLDGESMKDIARELDVTVNTVKTIKYRALERLSGLLSKDDFLLFVGLLGGTSNFF